MQDVTTGGRPGGGQAQSVQIIYILYLVGIAAALTTVVGVIWAYVARAETKPGDWEHSHLTFQIRTFWIGLLFGFVGAITTPILIGFAILLALLVWFVVRCAKGLIAHGKGQPVADPLTWLV